MKKMLKEKWLVHIISLFPDIFPGSLKYSLSGKAFEKQLWSLNIVNLRDFAQDKHHTVDDKPYGGGAGMVIKPDVLANAIDSILSNYEIDEILYMSPRGEVFKQHMAQELISKNILIICGRYEGIDQRIIDYYNIKELSIGDYILSGGEIAALTIIDACIRLIPDVIGNTDVHKEESFANETNSTNLLEYPHYTKPYEWRNIKVPDILVSGHHKNIKDWRKNQSEIVTCKKRPDIWKIYKNESI